MYEPQLLPPTRLPRCELPGQGRARPSRQDPVPNPCFRVGTFWIYLLEFGMKELIARLRRSYVDHGTNYVQEAADALERLNKEVKDLRDEVVAGDQDIEHLTEALEHLIAGAVACVEVVVQNERLFSENKMLDYKLKEEKKKTAELTADLESRARCMKYWQELYSKCNKDLYELEQKK